MPIYSGYKKTYRPQPKAIAKKRLAIILAVLALLAGAFVVINRLPKNQTPQNANTQNNQNANTTVNQSTTSPTNSQAINKQTSINTNTNATAETITEVTNSATNAVKVIEGVPKEIIKGDTGKKQVIFTFDAGSGTQSAQQILDTLKKYNLKATFFLTGKWAEKNGDLVKTISSAGHEIGNHTYSHPHLTQISDDEIVSELKKTEDIIVGLTGKSTKPYFRAPYGERNAHILEITAQAGYQSVYWSTDALDWEESTGMTADKVRARILAHLEPGEIYLMHVGDTITGNILDDVIKQIQEKGYNIVPLKDGI
jgi:peptidoglycan/xylan/chitin deacetylase (PgdA/CDA1 family)